MKRILVALTLFFAVAASAQVKVEPITTLPKLSETQERAISKDGYRITVNGKELADVWPASQVAGESNSSSAALYPEFPMGALAGVITFPNGGADFRGQSIKAGTYTMRYEQIPSDGNHMGVTPNPDFFLLVPADDDTEAGYTIPFARLVKMSAKSAGTAHPAAFSLAPASKTVGTATTDDKNHTVLTFQESVNGKKLAVGLIVSGTAEQ